MAPIKVHGITGSPPVRAVLLACKALGVDYEFKLVNTLRGDHKTPEFLKLNPLHTVPVIEDGDFVLFDSHAIVTYLADKSASDKWYPKDAQKRAVVDQRLHFDNAILFTRVRDILEPVLYFGEPRFRPELVKGLEKALELLDTVLGDNDFVAGSEPTVADCCCIASVSTMLGLVPRLPVPERVHAWVKRCEKALPYYKEVNVPGVKGISKLARNLWLRRAYGAFLGVEKRLSAALGRARVRRSS
ncbi:Glutathione S-transferase 1 [Frankliniella fusca]|uniref:Glutathione S-transferase 1 n=1 Tax=Frankliniella fusca TaxID=407009 RepID=A0AAE1LD14_9NEOP|nr:Glutathione S-transferase 1 [Frankliniella fusca]